MPDLFMVFDVESIGLHGEGFAVGWVVVTPDGQEVARGRHACDLSKADGDPAGRLWVREHMPTAREWVDRLTPADVRAGFWLAWEFYREQGAWLAADCPWPVEANFLGAAIWEKPSRKEQGPYPLIDVASVRLAAGLDPLGTNDRLPGELPAHDPLADARQSARLLIEALNR